MSIYRLLYNFAKQKPHHRSVVTSLRTLWKALVGKSARLDILPSNCSNGIDFCAKTIAHCAAVINDGELVEKYIRHGGDLDMRDGEANTALHLSKPLNKTAYGDFDSAMYKLITAGAHLDLPNTRGESVYEQLREQSETPFGSVFVMKITKLLQAYTQNYSM